MEKLKEKLKATERAQSTEENRSGGQLVAVRHRSVIAELDAVFYQRLTFRKDAWRACRRTAKQGSFVCREGVTRPLFKETFKAFEKQRDEGQDDFIEPDIRSASPADVRVHPLTGKAAFKTHTKRLHYTTTDVQVMKSWLWLLT